MTSKHRSSSGTLSGLSVLNIELTSKCNKSCWMCGRRKLEREYPDLCNWGDMPKEMVYEISKQVPEGVILQFHNNGEPLLYPHLRYALGLFPNNLRCFNTNGKLLLEKADEIDGNLETLTISVIENDSEAEEQYETVRKFLDYKVAGKPLLVYRLLGNVDNAERWGALPGVVARRILHSPDGSRDYTKPVTVPEIGVCLDLLTHLAIDRYGNVSVCVRFDPEKKLVIGNIGSSSLEEIWNGKQRRWIIDQHLEGLRHTVLGCDRCDYYGVPKS